jgi:hypothetical protein
LKQIKRIKSEFKRNQQLIATEKRKSDWLNFQQQQTKKRKGVQLSAVFAANKDSIFKTSDDPNAKVGVVKA